MKPEIVDQIPIYTVGYGARSIEALIRVLQAYEIAYVIDIRSQPYSKFKPDFSKAPLERSLHKVGIRYVLMGEELGGRPQDPACYTQDGKVDYAKCRGTATFQAGLMRLRQAYAQRLRVTLMCSEGKPQDCHRSKLIGEALTEHRIEVVHIDEDDHLKTQEQVINLISGKQSGVLKQEVLFPDSTPRTFTSRKKYRPTEGSEMWSQASPE